MPVQVEELADNKVRLTVDVAPEDLHHAVEHATSDLAGTVKIPGFRAGKVPPQVLRNRIERALTGASVGDTRSVEYAHPDGTTRDVEVTVKDVQEKVLPPADDELARAA